MKYPRLAAVLIGILLMSSLTVPLVPKKSRLKLVDYRKHLNKRFKRVKRKSTRYIIVHTSEAGLTSTLRTLSRGKSVGRYRTYGGHAHYTIARNGTVYRIMNHLLRADHAGLSMWNGREDLSSHSIGIELVGYHYDTITPQQYKSLTKLLKTLKRTYRVADKNVLTHSQISYGRPNMWFKRPHRGRKRCALNFQRHKAGLKGAWTYDPDVRARRLLRDHQIYATFYKKQRRGKTITKPVIAKKTHNRSVKKNPVTPAAASAETITLVPESPAKDGQPVTPVQPIPISNLISKQNSAWNIAGEDYDSPDTLYVLPDQQRIRGDKLEKIVGWDRIPTGTKVMVNQPLELENKKGPLYTISKELTAWSYAQADYRKPSTIYFLPDGRITKGDKMVDWDSIPNGTRMIVGYNGPIEIGAVQGRTPWSIAGRDHNKPDTFYFIPGLGLQAGDAIKDFTDLPRGSKVFLPKRGPS